MKKAAGLLGVIIGAAAGVAAYKFIKEKKAADQVEGEECCDCTCDEECACECEEKSECECAEQAEVEAEAEEKVDAE